MKVGIDQDSCVGCRLCKSICKEVFGFEDDRAITLVNNVEINYQDDVLHAKESCPVSAIVTRM